jgi:glycosyltransferase involved in cell wall biosynthesis
VALSRTPDVPITKAADDDVVTLLGTYIPGYKAGGPVRSIANLVDSLGKEFKFKIVTSDRDMGDTLPYAGVAKGRWVPLGSAEVMYLSPGLGGLFRLIALIRSLDSHSVLYLNSFFSRRFSIVAMVLRRLGICSPKCVVLAPRGEFSQGALKIKEKRKMLYIRLSSWLGFYRGVIWHASTTLEEADMRRAMPNLSFVRIADELPGSWKMRSSGNTCAVATAKDIHLLMEHVPGKKLHKVAGRLRTVFVSRISPMKNLLFALRMLQGLSGDISFDIYGPLESSEYWSQCRQIICKLPKNIWVRYMGAVQHDRVRDVFAEHDLLFLPTLGENYGHVICEALSVGCPVLISDQTPWRHLREKCAGWDIPLAETEQFRAILQQCVDADEEWYAGLVVGAKDYAKKAASDPAIVEDNRRIFRYAIAVS